MCSVAFLPKEFCSSKKKTWAHFPSHYVSPLIDQKWKIAVGIGPTRKSGTDNGLRSRANDVRLGKFHGRNHLSFTGFRVFFGLKSMVGDYGTFRRKTLSMLSFLLQIGKRDQKGEISILMSGRFESSIEITLDSFPNRKAPWLDDHTSTGFGIFRKIGSADNLLIPLGKVLCARGCDCIFWLCHYVRRIRESASKAKEKRG